MMIVSDDIADKVKKEVAMGDYRHQDLTLSSLYGLYYDVISEHSNEGGVVMSDYKDEVAKIKRMTVEERDQHILSGVPPWNVPFMQQDYIIPLDKPSCFNPGKTYFTYGEDKYIAHVCEIDGKLTIGLEKVID